MKSLEVSEQEVVHQGMCYARSFENSPTFALCLIMIRNKILLIFQALQREESFEEQIRDLTTRLKDVSMKFYFDKKKKNIRIELKKEYIYIRKSINHMSIG